MENIFGLDLGTNSIGFSLRNPNIDADIINQFENYGSTIFKKGVGSEKGIEFSYAAKRTQKRSIRRLNQSRKYRIWETLDVLMKNGFCPITEDELNQWRRYNKAKGLNRKYPVDALKFEQWVKLDFNGDGYPDYSSPFQLRKELATIQFDFEIEMNKFKIGRALYHIAQRRGFKSSKGETIKEQEKEAENKNEEINNNTELVIDIKKSEKKIAGKIEDFIEKKKVKEIEIKTVGWALAELENEGERIRENWTPIRLQYENEIKYIFEFQNQLRTESEFYSEIHKAIFFKRPLRSQKGLVGKCTLEPTKERCPVSHPEFETFRAWSFINNIQYREKNIENGGWINLKQEDKEAIFEHCFMRVKANFKFEEIVDFLTKRLNHHYTFNYKYNTNVAGCPVSARLKNLFGDDWRNYKVDSTNSRTDKKGISHCITYSIDDIWHVLFSFEDEENVLDFAKNKLFIGERSKAFLNLWLAIPQGYSMLSLKAIKNINRFLQKGLIYTDATLLAKMPEILGVELWAENELFFLDHIRELTAKNRKQKRILIITNNLISLYKAKSLEHSEQFAYKNTNYILDKYDFQEIESHCIDRFGEKTWTNISEAEQIHIKTEVATFYQKFFSNSKRDYYKIPKLGDTIKEFLTDNFEFLQCKNTDRMKDEQCTCSACKKVNMLYHPSQIAIYPQSKEQLVEYNNLALSLRLLKSPKTGAFKNPMAMRTLHELRKLINYLLLEGQINEETRIVVETARDLNDANMRWAIEAYQRQRESENKEYELAIRELLNDSDFNGKANPSNDDDIDRMRLLVDQFDIPEYGNAVTVEVPNIKGGKNKKKNEKSESFNKSPVFLQKIMLEKDLVKKYRLWKEQEFRCIYTGKIIKITDLFAENIIDFEHTIPRSISFDNSLENQTVCFADYNRTIKKKKIPYQLSNYSEILPRLNNWKLKIERLQENVEFWKLKSKKAIDKDIKDYSIRQRHLWQMELNYWKGKYERFTMKEVTSGFKNSQLVDTQLISRYALHYLKSVFSSVDVQKGNVTAVFRKIIGIQNEYEKKNRDQHSHHAIDASVLTLIPKAATRDKMLELFYKKQENKDLINGNKNSAEVSKLKSEIDKIESDLQYEIRRCKIGSANKIVKTIESNIVVNAITNDKTLCPARKALRKKGKPEPIRDNNKQPIHFTDANGNVKYRTYKDGNFIFKKDENGQFILDNNGKRIPIPIIVPKIATGDCIRGQLHEESFLGAIKKVKRDENNKPILLDGKFTFEDGLYYVIRKDLKYKKNDNDIGFKNLAEIKKDIVDPDVYEAIRKQVESAGSSLKDAIDKGIFMLGKDGKPKKIDKHGRPLNKIRHIRIFVRSTEPLKIKKQTYISSKTLVNLDNREHKQFYFANNASTPYYILYHSIINNRIERNYEIIKLFDAARLKVNNNLIVQDYIFLDKNETVRLNLHAILTIGQRVLFYKKNPIELLEIDQNELNKRLYVILGFEKDGRIRFKHHAEARDDKKLMVAFPEKGLDNEGKAFGKSGMNGFSSINWESPWPKLKLSKGNLNMLIENKDFKITPDGKIILNRI
ncbi:MAG: HNH endonuclease domain-containing protein [Lentimicrobium sp.]|jgi:CRISPR-associated endonuclease Csn1|nr:HNH endonuclease domain-containing protein [Lentimicrobium sp.]